MVRVYFEDLVMKKVELDVVFTDDLKVELDRLLANIKDENKSTLGLSLITNSLTENGINSYRWKVNVFGNVVQHDDSTYISVDGYKIFIISSDQIEDLRRKILDFKNGRVVVLSRLV